MDDAAGVRVDYAGLKVDRDWPRLVTSLALSDPAALRTRDERLAFWINAYNILAIDLVLRHYPVDSIKDVGSFFRPVWKRDAGTIAGDAMSLDHIEHGILRPLGEPRIHAAIVCASVSCPPLRREPFRARNLDAQLDDASRRFVAKETRVDAESGILWLSSILEWFAEDFERTGGVVRFVSEHAGRELGQAIAGLGSGYEIDHTSYDWRLNDLRDRAGGSGAE